MVRRTILFLCVFCLMTAAALMLCALLLCRGDTLAETADSLPLACENEHCRLYVSLEDGDFAVESKASGRLWRAFPENWRQDQSAKGSSLKLMGSLAALEVFNKKNVTSIVNSRADALEKDGMVCALTEDGFEAALDFKSVCVRVTMRVSLTEKGVQARVLPESVEEYGEDCTLSAIRVLPFFGAARPEDEGYIRLPDGRAR